VLPGCGDGTRHAHSQAEGERIDQQRRSPPKHRCLILVALTQSSRPCEHTFVTAQPNAHVRFRRAIEGRALWLAENAAGELPNMPLADALQLVHLYFERGSPKAEPAARLWLVRYLSEGTPSLGDVGELPRASRSSSGEDDRRIR
jgi:hypothetical protein